MTNREQTLTQRRRSLAWTWMDEYYTIHRVRLLKLRTQQSCCICDQPLQRGRAAISEPAADDDREMGARAYAHLACHAVVALAPDELIDPDLASANGDDLADFLNRWPRGSRACILAAVRLASAMLDGGIWPGSSRPRPRHARLLLEDLPRMLDRQAHRIGPGALGAEVKPRLYGVSSAFLTDELLSFVERRPVNGAELRAMLEQARARTSAAAVRRAKQKKWGVPELEQQRNWASNTDELGDP
jgi:hypothetical protein